MFQLLNGISFLDNNKSYHFYKVIIQGFLAAYYFTGYFYS